MLQCWSRSKGTQWAPWNSPALPAAPLQRAMQMPGVTGQTGLSWCLWRMPQRLVGPQSPMSCPPFPPPAVSNVPQITTHRGLWRPTAPWGLCAPLPEGLLAAARQRPSPQRRRRTGARKALGTAMAGQAVGRVRAAPALSPRHKVLPASALALLPAPRHRPLPTGPGCAGDRGPPCWGPLQQGPPARPTALPLGLPARAPRLSPPSPTRCLPWRSSGSSRHVPTARPAMPQRPPAQERGSRPSHGCPGQGP